MEANEKLGFPSELRQYMAAKDILADLKIKTVCLLTNNPDKVRKLTDLGVIVESTKPIEVKPSQYNEKYLRTKRIKMAHTLSKV